MLSIASKVFDFAIANLVVVDKRGDHLLTCGVNHHCQAGGLSDLGWFRGVFLWQALKFWLYLRFAPGTEKYSHMMDKIKELIQSNWQVVKSSLNLNMMAPINWDNWVSSASDAGDIKSQISSLWLALAYVVLEKPSQDLCKLYKALFPGAGVSNCIERSANLPEDLEAPQHAS